MTMLKTTRTPRTIITMNSTGTADRPRAACVPSAKRVLNMSRPFGARHGCYLDGVGGDDAHDHDLRPGRQLLLRGDGLVLDRAVLHADVDLADALLLGGHAQVDGTRGADRPLD